MFANISTGVLDPFFQRWRRPRSGENRAQPDKNVRHLAEYVSVPPGPTAGVTYMLAMPPRGGGPSPSEWRQQHTSNYVHEHIDYVLDHIFFAANAR
jgi:hypothetical protein